MLEVLSPLNAEAILIRQLNSENQAVLVETWGISSEIRQQYPVAYNLNDRYPTTDTLRNRATTFVNTLPDWGDDYPMLENLHYTTGAKSYICIPIERTGTPVAALGVFSRDVISPNVEIEAFLKAVGSVFSMHLFRQDVRNSKVKMVAAKYAPSRVQSSGPDLTERQQVILRLISEDRTNLVIGELLGYSESTIRQETIKIYAKLGCTGRIEATQIYREKYANT